MIDSYRKTREHYDKIYERYAKNSGVVMHNAIDLFLKYANKNGVILDMGCGPGHDVRYMIDHGYDAAGVDFSGNMIKYAKDHYGGSFYCLDVCEDDFFSNICKINDVWMSAMLMHLSDSDQSELLKKINNNIANNGVIGLIVPLKLPKGKANIGTKTEIIFDLYTKEKLYKLLDNAGFYPVVFSNFKFNDIEWGVVVANKSKP